MSAGWDRIKKQRFMTDVRLVFGPRAEEFSDGLLEQLEELWTRGQGKPREDYEMEEEARRREEALKPSPAMTAWMALERENR